MTKKPLKGKFPFRGFFTCAFLGALALNIEAASPSRLLAFAVDNRLTMMIGKYEPVRGWVQSTDFYTPPEPGDSFTLYGTGGMIGSVTIKDPQRADPNGPFAGWSAIISPWDNHAQPFALAVSGSDPLLNASLESIPLEDSKYRSIVSRFLKSKGLRVAQPFLTQALNIPIEGHDREEVLLLAHSDASALTDEKEAAVYAVALLWWNDHGKERIFPIASQTSFKPAGRTVEDHERLYGTRDFLRILAAADIDGDGWKDIVLYRAKADATQIDVFTFNGRRLRNVLSTYKPNYN